MRRTHPQRRRRSCALLLAASVLSVTGAAGPPPEEAAPPAPEPGGAPRQGLRRLGRGPAWAGESWFLRRQIGPPWALRGRHVVDVRRGEIRRHATIVIQGDLIRSVGDVDLPPGTGTIDIEGGFVIPGLFDLHAHVIPPSPFLGSTQPPEEMLRVLLEHGVTTIRLLPFHTESAVEWAGRVNSGHLPGPTIVPAGGILEREAERTSLGFGDPATARAWVQKDALLGARWIKVYNRMDEESLEAIIEAARAFGMRVCGHTEDVPPHRASELGIGSVEHIVSIPLSCTGGGPEAGPPLELTGPVERTAQRWERVDDAELAELLRTFKENGTAWVPTLVASEGAASDRGFAGAPPDDRTRVALDAALRGAAQAAVRLHREGGLVGLGTDFPIAGVPAGASAHRELAILVEMGGATPLEALRIGTIGSARVLGFESILGTVEAGRVANLVVLAADPLEDIAAVRQIALVIHDGRRHEVPPP